MSHLNLIDPTYGESGYQEIVGSSPALKSALLEVRQVAPTDAAVLVLGETGTGKELIAHAIHNLSPRSECPFVKLDCAAIPFDLLESELFGQEIGGFPRAIARNVGRFEMADTGTLFLDEIGDLPVALQPKLLRILQEQEFERPGSGRTRCVNVRLVAATNRNLMDMVKRRGFRSDLYYRLSGFPITLPPLRDRRQDIALLVSHFVEMFSRRVGKRIHRIPEDTLSAFTAHSWPGNVRELKNLIERAVILSNDGVLPNPLRVSDRISMTEVFPHGTFNASRQTAIRPHNGVVSDPLAISDECTIATADGFGHEPGPACTAADLSIVFVVDYDASARESVELLIRQEGWQPETLACARDFLDRSRPRAPHCLVLDVRCPWDLNGFDLERRIAVERTETPIIFIAGQGDVPASVQAMKAGAVEFLIKPFDDETFVGAIRRSLKRSSVALGREAEMRPVRERYASLSHRERQVMALVLSGLLNKQVGAELGISEITVKAHRGRVMQKMEAKSVVDLVKMATRLRSERVFSGPDQFRSPSPSRSTASSARTMTVSSSSGETALAAASRSS